MLLPLYFLVLTLLSQSLGYSSSTTLTDVDKTRLEQVLKPGWDLQDLSLVMYAASGYKNLGIKVPEAKAACTYVSGLTSGNPSTETIFMAASAAQFLGCPISATPQLKQTLQGALNEGSSMLELYHAVLGLNTLGVKVDTGKVLPIVQSALKKDDRVLHLGYAFHIASVLTGDTSSIFERIEDAVVQADEVDGKMLQFEGGLPITALVVDGAYKLSEAVKKPVPLRPEQAVKFANYLLSRKSVQLPKGVHYLLQALTMFTTNKYHIPVSISLASSVAVSSSQSKVQVSVTDLLGNSIGAGVKVMADAVVKDSDGTKLTSNVVLSPLKNSKTMFEFDAMALKPVRGFYKLSISATGNDQRLVGNVGASLKFKVLASISVENVEFGTADADQSAAPALKKIAYGSKLSGGALDADRHQKVLLRFLVKEADTGADTLVHQAFVRITHQQSKREIIYVAEADANNLYKFDMSVSQSMAEFKGISGIYSVELIVGDACISNPLRWHLADLSLNFPGSAKTADTPDYTYKAKPAIEHQFQEADKRPPVILSTVFAVLCLAPLLVLLILWGTLGVNISNFPFSLTSFGFHLGIGGIFVLYCMFWLQLNMFHTLRYLLVLGVFTFYCGNSMLSRIASTRKDVSK